MNVVKYSTEHLVCYLVKDNLGQEHYQIFESDKLDKPMAIYVDRQTMHLADEFPIPETSYKYFSEMCEVIQFLYELN